jgi:hypothetical protein
MYLDFIFLTVLISLINLIFGVKVNKVQKISVEVLVWIIRIPLLLAYIWI